MIFKLVYQEDWWNFQIDPLTNDLKINYYNLTLCWVFPSKNFINNFVEINTLKT